MAAQKDPAADLQTSLLVNAPFPGDSLTRFIFLFTLIIPTEVLIWLLTLYLFTDSLLPEIQIICTVSTEVLFHLDLFHHQHFKNSFGVNFCINFDMAAPSFIAWNVQC